MPEIPVIELVQPMPGFPDRTRFTLVQLDEDGVLCALRSLDDPDLRFLVVSPVPFFPDYEPVVDDQTVAELGITSVEDVLVLLVADRRRLADQHHRQPAGAGPGEHRHPPRAPGHPGRPGPRDRHAARRLSRRVAGLPRRIGDRDGKLGAMLVLSRRPGESVVIGDDVTISILEVRGDVVRVGISAPRSVAVHRAELLRELENTNREAASPSEDAVASLSRALKDRKE